MIPQHLVDVLYKHQKTTLNKYRMLPTILNATMMGLGKSAPTAIYARERLEETGKPVLVVCPAYLCRNWQREFEKFAEIKATVYPEVSSVTIVSIDRIYRTPQLFKDLSLLVVDEASYVTNLKARRTKALHEFVTAYRPERLILLSGTPMRGKIPQLYSLLLLLDFKEQVFRRRFPSEYVFCNTFCEKELVRVGGGMQVTRWTGLRNKQKLLDILLPKYIRYRMDEVHDMPEVVHQDVEVEEVFQQLDVFLAVDEYTEEYVEGWMKMALNKRDTHIMSQKRAMAESKVPITAEYVEGLLDSDRGPVLVFTDHINTAKMLLASFKERKRTAAMIIGGSSLKERDESVTAFQDGKLDVLIGTIGAMAMGLTLHRSNICVFNDISYNPSDNLQAAGRIRRIGQKRTCFVTRVVRQGLDEAIANVVRKKEDLMHQIIDSKLAKASA